MGRVQLVLGRCVDVCKRKQKKGREKHDGEEKIRKEPRPFQCGFSCAMGFVRVPLLLFRHSAKSYPCLEVAQIRKRPQIGLACWHASHIGSSCFRSDAQLSLSFSCLFSSTQSSTTSTSSFVARMADEYHDVRLFGFELI